MNFKLVEAAESKICCICKKPFDGYGNNAEPVCSGSCCDECNMKEVIPARMKMLDNSSSEDLDEAVLNETDESGNDDMDANCYDCGAVITIPVDHDGPAYCASCMKNHLNETREDYKIIYYLSTATAEHRPETVEDVENDWKEDVFAADSDYDALLYALELIDSGYDDTDFSTAEEIVKYFEEKDLGDGSAFVIKLEGPNGVIYDMSQTKEDFIDQVKENDKMLDYYRSVLGIDESLNEAIDPSKALEIKKNSDADIIFYGYQYKNEDPVEIDPEECSTEEYKNRKNQIVSDYNKLYADKPQANRYAKEHDFIFYALYNRKNESDEKDDNKMNEDMSIRAKLKALYPELDFGDEVTEGFDDDMEFNLDECNEQRFMETLYNGTSKNESIWDDEEDANEEFDSEDDEFIDDEDIDYDDEDPEWWNDTLDDETGDFIYEAAEELGLEDFWFEDGGFEGAHTPTEFGYTKDGVNYRAECDYEDTDVHSVRAAVKLLKNLDWRAD